MIQRIRCGVRLLGKDIRALLPAILALACKRSVRSGERLNDADIRELVSRVADKRVIPASPRGTPLVVALNKTDIDRRFRRMQ